MIVVVDASVAAKWYVEEDHTAEAQLLFDENVELHAPELFLAEFGNICWKKVQRGDIDLQLAESANARLAVQNIVYHRHRDLFRPAFLGAVQTSTSAYDWMYFALAIALDCPFITADRKFFLAMRRTKFKKHIAWIEAVRTLISSG